MALVMNVSKKLGKIGFVNSYAGHNERLYVPKNADPEKKHLNFKISNGVVSSLEYEKSFGERLNTQLSKIRATKEKVIKGKKIEIKNSIRKDAVRYIPYVFSGDRTDFKNKSDDEIRQWAMDSYQWLQKIHSEENIISFNVHLDETTPHIHAAVVPLTFDGRLCAKEWLDDGGNIGVTRLREMYHKDVANKYQIAYGRKGGKFDYSRTRQFYENVDNLEYLSHEINQKEEEKREINNEIKRQQDQLNSIKIEKNKRLKKILIGKTADEKRLEAENAELKQVLTSIKTENSNIRKKSEELLKAAGKLLEKKNDEINQLKKENQKLINLLETAKKMLIWLWKKSEQLKLNMNDTWKEHWRCLFPVQKKENQDTKKDIIAEGNASRKKRIKL
jgi:hypothetical protein